MTIFLVIPHSLTYIPSPQRSITSPFAVPLAAPIPEPGSLCCILSTASLPTARGVGDWETGKMVSTPVPGMNVPAGAKLPAVPHQLPTEPADPNDPTQL